MMETMGMKIWRSNVTDLLDRYGAPVAFDLLGVVRIRYFAEDLSTKRICVYSVVTTHVQCCTVS